MLKLVQIENFKAGKIRQSYQYKSFLPEPVNRQWIISDPNLLTLLSEASRYLGELNAFSYQIPDIDFFIRMHVAKEAVTSSRIEGTQTNIAEAFLKREEIIPEKRDDWQEVQNYIEAVNTAIKLLEDLPLSNRLIRQTHKILLQSVRGKHKQPGSFRKTQNWIGGASLKDAIFIPPHPDDVPDLISDLEKFLNNDRIQIPELLRIAIAHYQFETIHPFLDGNGRIGRLMITLYLVNKKLLVKPSLYLSDFFERNRMLYYDNLSIVRYKNDLGQWLKFFLTGVVETAQNSISTFQSILTLKEESEKNIVQRMGKRARSGLALLNYLFRHPLVSAAEISKALKVSSPTANTLLRNLAELNILQEITGYKRNRMFAFTAYLDIFRN